MTRFAAVSSRPLRRGGMLEAMKAKRAVPVALALVVLGLLTWAAVFRGRDVLVAWELRKLGHQKRGWGSSLR